VRPFVVAGGSVAGRAHLAVGRGNQDAWAWAATPAALVAVACDGCGSAPHSEVGAQCGARLAVAAALRHLGEGVDPADERLRAALQAELLGTLGGLARAMGGSFGRTLEDFFLFTLVIAMVTPARTAIVSLGDGLFAVNGVAHRVGPFPNNEPPYLAYALLEDGQGARGVRFVVHEARPTSEVRSLVVGTDGAAEVVALDEFWREARYVTNPDMVRRRLAVLRREASGVPGRMADDTTLVVIRRVGES
jgi:hypothetical protein